LRDKAVRPPDPTTPPEVRHAARADSPWRGRRRLWWIFVGLATAYLGLFVSSPHRFFPLGVQHFGTWFIDAYAILAALDAAALGRDIYAANPLDLLNRPHVYSVWWLALGKLGLTRADTPWIGFLLGSAFFAVAVARLRPREWREIAWCFVVFCATPTLLAIERANNDVVVFLLLAPVVPCLLSSRPVVRLLPVPLIALATGLKFYPAAAGLLLLAGDRRDVRIRIAIAVPVLAAVGWSLAGDLRRMDQLMPRPDGILTFGATHVLGKLGLGGVPGLAAGAMYAVVAAAAWWRVPAFRARTIDPVHKAEWLYFALGASLLTACFFSAANFAYRWIFSIWMAPLLWRLSNDAAAAPGVRRVAAATAALLFLMLWGGPLAALVLNVLHVRGARMETIAAFSDGYFRVEQPFAWAFFTCLIGFLTHFVRSTLQRT
jgi:hypothetical protein